MSAVEVRDRLADRFRLLAGVDAGAGASAHAAPRGRVVLRPADRRRAGRCSASTSVFAGGFDLASICAVVDGADDVDVLRHLDSLVRKSLVVADHTATRTRYRLFETIRQFAEDRLAETGALERDARSARRVLRRRGGRALGALERARVARRGRLGGGRARQPARRVPVERGARRPRGRDRHRRARRAHGVLGAAVRDARLGRGAARAGDRGRRPPPSPPLHRGRLRVLRRAGRGRARERAPGDRAGGRRPLRRVRARVRHRSSRRWAASTAATSTATSSSPATVARRGTAASGATASPSYVDGLQSCGRIEEALALTEESVAAARSLGNPYWIAYALWIAGHGLLEGGRAPRVRGVGRGRRLRARASRPVLRRLPRARRGAPAHVRRRARGRARCCSPTRSPRSSAPATCRS